MGRVLVCVTHMLMWVILSGHFDKFFLSVGVVCSIFSVVLRRRLDVVVPVGEYSAHPSFGNVRPLAMVRNLLQYCCWLVWQIIVSAWFVVKMIFCAKGSCTPIVTTISVPHSNGLELFMLANSVTATPGTVGMKAAPGGNVRVLALDGSLLDGVLEISNKIRGIFYT